MRGNDLNVKMYLEAQTVEISKIAYTALSVLLKVLLKKKLAIKQILYIDHQKPYRNFRLSSGRYRPKCPKLGKMQKIV